MRAKVPAALEPGSGERTELVHRLASPAHGPEPIAGPELSRRSLRCRHAETLTRGLQPGTRNLTHGALTAIFHVGALAGHQRVLSTRVRPRVADAESASGRSSQSQRQKFLIAVVVRAPSPGAGIFRQQRIGRHGLPFTIFKFRTMHASLPGSGRSSHEDHRLTGPGRFLRRYKLDELPQLINVIRGDMSLVGPRPKLLDHHTLDLCVRPGVTGAATLAFASEELLLREIAPEHLEACHHQLVSPRKLELDLDYMARATFRSDLSLLWQTLMRTGRYTSLAELGRWTAPATEAAAADGILPWPARTTPEREAPGSARAWMQHGEQLSLVPGGFHRSEIAPPAASS